MFCFLWNQWTFEYQLKCVADHTVTCIDHCIGQFRYSDTPNLRYLLGCSLFRSYHIVLHKLNYKQTLSKQCATIKVTSNENGLSHRLMSTFWKIHCAIIEGPIDSVGKLHELYASNRRFSFKICIFKANTTNTTVENLLQAVSDRFRKIVSESIYLFRKGIMYK